MKSKAKFTWSDGEYNEEGDAMHSDQCRQSTGSKCICPPLKQERSDVSASEHMPTPWRVIEKSDHYEIASAEQYIFSVGKARQGAQDAAFIVLAVNCHVELVEALKGAVRAIEYLSGTTQHELLYKAAKKALAKAENR